jgi:hypothetical protein
MIIIDWLTLYWDALITMTAEMAPYLLFGFFIAGLLRVFVPKDIYSKHLAPRNMKSVFKAALFGIPLPLCSCGVIPTAVGLRKQGASHGACTGFLIATPQTGVDSIVATYSLMGLPFAIVRPVAALFTSVFGGWLTNRYAKDDETHSEKTAADTDAEECSCGCDDCCCESEHEHTDTFAGKMREALSYAFIEMMQDVGKWLIVGLLIAALITVAVPNEWLAALHDYKLLNMLIVLAVAIPMYVCATGSIPIAVSLMAKGLTPGAALVLLMAGPAVNSASMLVIGKVFGRRTLWLYILSIVIGSMLFGLGIDYLLPQEWFTVQSRITGICAHHTVGLTTMDWIWIALLTALLVNALLQHYFGHSHHHHHHEHHDETCAVEVTAVTVVYHVSGMNCNHCKANVERAIRQVPGVTDVTVDLAAGTAIVSGTHDTSALIGSVKSFGYDAAL